MTRRSTLSACVVALALGAAACGTTDPYVTTMAAPRVTQGAAAGMSAEQTAQPTAAAKVEYDRPVAWPSEASTGDGPSWWYDPIYPSMVVVHARPESAQWPASSATPAH